jgi:hypothetical protein
MKIKLYKTTLLATVLLVACSENLLDKVNPNGGTPQTYYSTTDELTKGVNAIYAVAQSINLVAREWFFVHDLRSDDMATGGGQLEVPRAQILTGANDAANSVSQSVWNGFFELIHRSNSVISGSVNAGINVSDVDKRRFVGEARFLRAWAYSDLIVLWGPVPLYTEPVTSIDGGKARTPVSDINQFLIDELTAIQADLPVSYGTADKGRATQGAAQALLARVYMFKGDYASAKTELDKIVASGVYSLVPNYYDNFKEETPYNSESIFEIGYFNSNNNWNGNGDNGGGVNEGNTRTQEYSVVGWRNLIPSDALLAEYETTFNGSPKDDPRFADTFVRIGDMVSNPAYALAPGQVQGNLSTFQGGQEKISWKKYTSIYKTDATFYTGPMDMRIIRYAEVLLNLAECENQLGNNAGAIGYLNQVRNRASVSMPPYPNALYPCSNKDETFAAVVHERRVELAGEQIRNRDLVRWRNNGLLATDPIAFKKALLKIPATEIATNPNISEADQN